MESLMPLLPLTDTDMVQDLHEANSRLSFWLDSLVSCPGEALTQARAATPQQMAGLLSELMRAGQWLRALPGDKGKDKGAALEQELNEYRKNVERLRDLLPSIHAALLRERARIEQERARLQSAAAWARSSRQTL
jgi:hypothetical protein